MYISPKKFWVSDQIVIDHSNVNSVTHSFSLFTHFKSYHKFVIVNKTVRSCKLSWRNTNNVFKTRQRKVLWIFSDDNAKDDLRIWQKCLAFSSVSTCRKEKVPLNSNIDLLKFTSLEKRVCGCSRYNLPFHIFNIKTGWEPFWYTILGVCSIVHLYGHSRA